MKRTSIDPMNDREEIWDEPFRFADLSWIEWLHLAAILTLSALAAAYWCAWC